VGNADVNEPLPVAVAVASRPVQIVVRDATLDADLVVPARAIGVVAFAHGSGSSRHSPRNRAVAQTLNGAGIATLLLDLLTPEEEARDQAAGTHRFDIPLLARRLADCTDWLRDQPEVRGLPLGYFGASTGAAAALAAAAGRGNSVAAIVSRGGRPDLARSDLHRVTAPTLLLVGERDSVVVELNIEAQRQLGRASDLHIVPGASHLFEEPGTLELVADLARDWFVHYFERWHPSS
jgi:putative phosphoribosyl transferase